LLNPRGLRHEALRAAPSGSGRAGLAWRRRRRRWRGDLTAATNGDAAAVLDERGARRTRRVDRADAGAAIPRRALRAHGLLLHLLLLLRFDLPLLLRRIVGRDLAHGATTAGCEQRREREQSHRCHRGDVTRVGDDSLVGARARRCVSWRAGCGPATPQKRKYDCCRWWRGATGFLWRRERPCALAPRIGLPAMPQRSRTAAPRPGGRAQSNMS